MMWGKNQGILRVAIHRNLEYLRFRAISINLNRLWYIILLFIEIYKPIFVDNKC